MSAPHTNKQPFFRIASWYCLIAPLAVTAIAAIIYAKEGDTPAVDIAFFVCISGFVLGVVGLYMTPRHGATGIFWMALIGLILSCCCGLCTALAIYSRIAPQ
jgi:hypothetical protein